MRDEAVALQARLEAARAVVAQASGRDSSEQVRVVLDADGRVGRVEVTPGWRSRLAARHLGGAVLAAYGEAGNRRLETWAAEIGQASPAPAADRERATAPPPDTNAVVGADSIRDLYYLLQDASDRLDEIGREAAARGRAVTDGRDPGGHVTATLTGGLLSAVRLDEPWSGRAGGDEIGAAVTAAITAGYAAIDHLAEQSVAGRWPFPELERFTTDPAALVKALGLTDPQR